MHLKSESSLEPPSRLSRSRAWLQALRLHFVLPSILPGILGGIIAWSHGHPFKPLEFLLAVAGVAVNHCGLNMVDDVFDHLQMVDTKTSDGKNPFTGGSGVLADGGLSVREMLAASALCFGMTMVIGFYLTYVCGFTVLMFGLFGMASSVFYTMPPIKFGYRGFGELALLINFGPVIVLGAYFVQAGRLAWEPLIASLVLGWMMWSMILINEIPDFEADRRGGKNNLVVLFGKEKAVWLYQGGLVAAYAVAVLGILFGRLSPYSLFIVISLPWALKSVNILQKHRDDPLRLAPANLAMIRVHASAGLALICAYVLQRYFPISSILTR